MKQLKQWMISAILIVCGLPLLTSCSKDDKDDEQPPQPQKVTRWECILFGSYPANEVVSDSGNDPARRFRSTLYAKCRGAWWSPVDGYLGTS